MFENVKIVFLIGVFGLCVCDVSFENRRVFVPSSWGQNSDSIPPAREYGAPPAGEYGAPPVPTSVSITQENIEFAGQGVEINTPASKPSNSYLSPRPSGQFSQLRKPTTSTEAFLPKKNRPKPFRPSLNTGEVLINTQSSAEFRNQPTFFVGELHLPHFEEIKQFKAIAQQQQIPSNEYGAPPCPYPPSASPSSSPPPPPPVHETVDETPPAGGDTGFDTNDPTVIAVANANGQYYILQKDNTLQRVVYQTSQSEDDTINNGFTAHLRYSLVEPIRDPIYGYDEQGHLVRLYNKK